MPEPPEQTTADEAMQKTVDYLRRVVEKQRHRIAILEDELRKAKSAPEWVKPIVGAVEMGRKVK